MPSDLPIVTPDPPRRSQSERYGTLYYLGLAGLATVILLVAWFAVGLWSLRGYLAEVYTLHDPKASDGARVNAALDLSRSERTGARQTWDDALDRRLPPLARYLMAESLTAEAAEGDPRAYALSASRSEGWPDWLRVLIARPMAYSATSGGPVFPAEALAELRKRPDPILGLWAAGIQALQGDPAARSDLGRVSGAPGPRRELAQALLGALEGAPERRRESLDRATAWLRANHPGALDLWKGWELREGRLRKRIAP